MRSDITWVPQDEWVITKLNFSCMVEVLYLFSCIGVLTVSRSRCFGGEWVLVLP